MLIEQFERLADRLEAKMAGAPAQPHDPSDHLATHAATVLGESTELLTLDPALLLSELVSDPTTWVPQPWDNNFGHPGVTVVERESFRVDVLYWLENACPIHNHVSCGAFAAVRGRRLHLVYDFDDEHTWDGETATGRLTLKLREIMHGLDVHPIRPTLLHELFWLERPSVTISVRCRNHPTALPASTQFMAPNLSYVPAPLQETSTVSRWLSGLQLLRRANSQLYRDAVANAARVAPASYVVHSVLDLVESPAELDALVESLSVIQPKLVEELGRALPEFRRRRIFAAMKLRNIDARLLSALLWSGAIGDEFALLARREGFDDPEAFVDTHASAVIERDQRAERYVQELRASLR